jgi:hypothetical protein
LLRIGANRASENPSVRRRTAPRGSTGACPSPATFYESPYWSKDSKSNYYQDLAADGQPIMRLEVASRKSPLLFNFGELLRSEAMSYRLNGIGPDDSLYVRALSGKTDLYILDLALP